MESLYFFEGMDYGLDEGDPRLLPPVETSTTRNTRVLLEPPIISGCTFLRPSDNAYKDRIARTYNARTVVYPALFAVCDTAGAIVGVLSWARSKAISFTIRGGAHSYEGFSGNSHLVIDTSKLNQVVFDKPKRTVTVGAGATLGDVQTTLKGSGYALACGTCPTVGVAGHVLGGGYGFLARAYGLATDSLLDIRLVDPKGKLVVANASTRQDLYWACRGGGGGSFGVVLSLTLRVHPVDNVDVFSVSWSLSQDLAAKLIAAWQKWAPLADRGVTALLKVGKGSGQNIILKCIGKSVAARTELEKGLKILEAVAPPSTPRSIQKMTFWQAFQKFAGTGPDPYFQKERSDFLPSLSDEGIKRLLRQIGAQAASDVGLIFNAYGGAINDLAEDATAFPHRSGVGFMIHYYAGWDDPKKTKAKVDAMTAFYDGLRAYVPGKAYVNYSDAQLENFATAYWGKNLPRLKTVKRAFDPNNLFKFKQSVPLQ